MGLKNGIKWLLHANRAIAWQIRLRLPYAFDMQDFYASLVGQNIREGQVIVDVGAGKSCPFKRFASGTQTLIGIDISPEEISQNRDLDVRLVCDVCHAIPLEDNSVDMIVSRSVVEHLPDVEKFVHEAMRVLKPGGLFIHTLPCRFAPFAVINQALPNQVTKKLLAAFQEENKGICGFPAVYDRCWPSGMRATVQKHGLRLRDLRVCFFQSNYFSFFIPLFLLSVLYESVISSIGFENLAASMLVVAEKPLSDKLT